MSRPKIPIVAILDLIRLAPELVALIGMIRRAAADKRLTPEETRELGAALVSLVVAIVGELQVDPA